MLRHIFDGLLRKCTENNRIHPALQIMRDIAEVFTGVNAVLRLIHKHRSTAHAGNSSLERKACTQRWLFKKHHHLFSSKGAAKVVWPGFYDSRKIKHSLDALWAQVASGNQIRAPKRSGANRGFGSDTHSIRWLTIHLTLFPLSCGRCWSLFDQPLKRGIESTDNFVHMLFFDDVR